LSMDSRPILVVDDDPDILKILQDNLELDGYRISIATSGKEALRAFEELAPQLIILDLTLPDIDGIQVCRRIRDKSDVPIIMLTARDRISDRVLGLESGADDYVPKPFDYLELSARIKARLRRRVSLFTTKVTVELGRLRIDPATHTASKDGLIVSLTRSQFNLLLLLARNPGQALSRTTIRHNLWPDGEIPSDSRAIDVHVQHLRAKIEDDPANPTFILTVPGVGYMLAQSEE
jgi:DNA-binding response OmpR family regulator